MIFTSLHFAAFFVVVYAAYRLLPHRAQNWLLLGASYYFYAAWDWRFLSLLIGSTVIALASACVLLKIFSGITSSSNPVASSILDLICV